MTINLKIAFLPLNDAAVLVAARERGFAEEEGIALDLVRTTSWATRSPRRSSTGSAGSRLTSSTLTSPR